MSEWYMDSVNLVTQVQKVGCDGRSMLSVKYFGTRGVHHQQIKGCNYH